MKFNFSCTLKQASSFHTSVSAGFAVLHVVVLFLFLVVGAILFAMRTTPLPFGRFVQLGIETHQMVRARASVAKDDLTTLLTHLREVGINGKQK